LLFYLPSSITVYKGEILAQQLASLGAKLILSARDEADLNRVKSQLKGTINLLLFYVCEQICTLALSINV